MRDGPDGERAAAARRRETGVRHDHVRHSLPRSPGACPYPGGVGSLAEQKGFDFCWFPHDTFCKSTWVLTTAVAMRTERIKIGSVGTSPYTFDPSEIATYIATLDELSGGRAVLGLGTPYGRHGRVGGHRGRRRDRPDAGGRPSGALAAPRRDGCRSRAGVPLDRPVLPAVSTAASERAHLRLRVRGGLPGSDRRGLRRAACP